MKKIFCENFSGEIFGWKFFGWKFGVRGWRVEGPDGRDGVNQGEVSTIRLGMLESSGFQKYSTLLVIQLFSRRLCLCHCLCIRLCLCICVPNSFLNSYYHKLSENVWVWGCGATRSEIYSDVTIAGRRRQQGKLGLLSHWTMEGWEEQLWGFLTTFFCIFNKETDEFWDWIKSAQCFFAGLHPT